MYSHTGTHMDVLRPKRQTDGSLDDFPVETFAGGASVGLPGSYGDHAACCGGREEALRETGVSVFAPGWDRVLGPAPVL